MHWVHNEVILIGRAVAHRRSEYYLLTKCGHASGFDRPDWDPRLLTASIERSLRRLRTDHVDVVQLHSCSVDVLRQGAVVDVLQRAREAGKTRYLGYSGDGETARSAVACGAFDTLQTSMNVADQEAIDLTLPLANARGIGMIAKRPLANVAWQHGTRPADPYIQAYWERLRRLDYDFLGRPLGEAVGTALRFTLGVEGVHAAIVGSARSGRWQENAALLTAGPLAGEAFEAIRGRWHATAPTGTAKRSGTTGMGRAPPRWIDAFGDRGLTQSTRLALEPHTAAHAMRQGHTSRDVDEATPEALTEAYREVSGHRVARLANPPEGPATYGTLP